LFHISFDRHNLVLKSIGKWKRAKDGSAGAAIFPPPPRKTSPRVISPLRSQLFWRFFMYLFFESDILNNELGRNR